MPSTEEESNGTIAILLLSGFSTLGSTVEEVLPEAGCYISCELHTLLVQSFMYLQYIFSYQGMTTAMGKERRSILGCFAFYSPAPFHSLTYGKSILDILNSKEHSTYDLISACHINCEYVIITPCCDLCCN